MRSIAAAALAVLHAAAQPATIQVDWSAIQRPLQTVAGFQTVVNPLTTRDSPIHDQVYGAIAALGAQYQRYVPWLPYPKLGVGALEPPSGDKLCAFVNYAGDAFNATLDCGAHGVVSSLDFVSFGSPSGFCGGLTASPTCDAPSARSVIEGLCLGKQACTLPGDAAAYGGYSCGASTTLRLAVQATCSAGGGFTSWNFTLLDEGMLDFITASGSGNRTAIPNFSTPPEWLYQTPGRVLYPDGPLDETWNYEQGTQLRDGTLQAFGDYYGRLYAHYLEGGFTDEYGTFIPGHRLNVTHIELLNEVEAEHSYTPTEYVAVYDAMVAGIRKWAPTGSKNVKFVGLALEGASNYDFVTAFLNHSNHAPGTPLDMISFHHYASASDRSGGANGSAYEQFFGSADDFVGVTANIIAIRDALSPSTLLDADEIGVILPDDNDAKWTSDAPGFPLLYWNAAAAYFAYLYGRTSAIGLDVLGCSQLVGYPALNFTLRNGQLFEAPPQYPSVAMLNWTTGEGTARYWGLKLLIDEFNPAGPAGNAPAAAADVLVNTSVVTGAPPAANPFCGAILNLDTLSLSCADAGATINAIQFASYGTPTGTCGAYAVGACNAPNSTAVVEAACLGQHNCSVYAGANFGPDPCYGTVKQLVVQATCTGSGGGYQPPTAPLVYAQAYVEAGGSASGAGRKVLVVNKSSSPQAVTLQGAAGGSWTFVDESTGFGPAATVTLPADSWTLAPFAMGVVRLPQQ